MMHRDRLPRSNRLRPGLTLLEARCLLSGAAGAATAQPQTAVDYSPVQIRHAYGFDQLPEDGTGQTIAIIDPYEDANITTDLATFDSNYSLPVANLQVGYYQNGSLSMTTPPSSSIHITDYYGAAYTNETSLDVEWAHAIAPGATILLVQTYDNSASSIVAAAQYVANNGKANQVSISIAFAGDSPSVATIDSDFSASGVSFFASSGDNGSTASNGSSVNTPAESDHVVAVGGTTLTLDGSNNITSETGWSGSGGGVSSSSRSSYYEPKPAFQNGFETASGRGVPDVAYDADPNTGYSIVADGSNTSAAGTSAGTPQWAALAALVNQGRAQNGLPSIGLGLDTALYALAGDTSYTNANGDFHDIQTGSNGEYSAATGYDNVTGLGSPVANKLVPNLIAYGVSGTIAPTVPDSGFENLYNPVPNSTTGATGYTYDPGNAYYSAIAYWQFSGNAGVTHDNTGFTGTNKTPTPPQLAPGGTQVGFVQQQGVISETVANFAAGTYQLSILAAQRAAMGPSDQVLQVLVDGNLVGTITPSSTSYQSYTTGAFSVGAGSHVITFQGTSTSDYTAFLDNVSIAAATAPTAANAQAGATTAPSAVSDPTSPAAVASSVVAVPFGSIPASAYPAGPLGLQPAPAKRSGVVAISLGDSRAAGDRTHAPHVEANRRGDRRIDLRPAVLPGGPPGPPGVDLRVDRAASDQGPPCHRHRLQGNANTQPLGCRRKDGHPMPTPQSGVRSRRQLDYLAVGHR